jgi:hypothetical protein
MTYEAPRLGPSKFKFSILGKFKHYFRIAAKIATLTLFVCLLLSSFHNFVIAQDTYESQPGLDGRCSINSLTAQGHWDCLASSKRFLCVGKQFAIVDPDIKKLAISSAPIQALETFLKAKLETSGLSKTVNYFACQGVPIQASNKGIKNFGDPEQVLNRVEVHISLDTRSASPLSQELLSWKIIKEDQSWCWLYIFCVPPIALVLFLEFEPNGSVKSVKSNFVYEGI